MSINLFFNVFNKYKILTYESNDQTSFGVRCILPLPPFVGSVGVGAVSTGLSCCVCMSPLVKLTVFSGLPMDGVRISRSMWRKRQGLEPFSFSQTR